MVLMTPDPERITRIVAPNGYEAEATREPVRWLGRVFDAGRFRRAHLRTMTT